MSHMEEHAAYTLAQFSRDFAPLLQLSTLTSPLPGKSSKLIPARVYSATDGALTLRTELRRDGRTLHFHLFRSAEPQAFLGERLISLFGRTIDRSEGRPDLIKWRIVKCGNVLHKADPLAGVQMAVQIGRYASRYILMAKQAETELGMLNHAALITKRRDMHRAVLVRAQAALSLEPDQFLEAACAMTGTVSALPSVQRKAAMGRLGTVLGFPKQG